jgi:hypothetical protein
MITSLASLPKARLHDADMVTKARHMLGRYPVEYVSNYLGMVEDQANAIKRSMPTGVTRGRPPKVAQ